MKRDSRLSLVLHALLHMAQRDDSMTSEQLAACLNTNPVVVRRTLGLLRQAGIVASERGHAGGWHIAADLAEITLRDLHVALGEPQIFAIGNRDDMPVCLVEQAVNASLNDAFDEAEALLLARLQRVTLQQLATDFACRFANQIRQDKEDRNVS